MMYIDLPGRDLLLTRDFSAGELASRRERVAQEIGEGASLLLAAAPPVPEDRSVQDASFYYFTGLEICQCYALVEGSTGRTTLYLASRDAMHGEPEDCLGYEDDDLLRERLGVNDVQPLAELNNALSSLKHLFLPHCEVEGGGATRFAANGAARKMEADPWDECEPRHKRLIRHLKARFPQIEIEDACPLIDRLRTIKSPAEIAVMREAGKLSARVMVESMKATRPGMVENRLQAIAEYVFRDEGHCGPGYAVIAAGGQRTWDGHYHLNNVTLGEDEIVLMDCGPDLRHYTSDIARLWPVNGQFSPWHRQVYGFIVEYHKVLLSLVRPGITPQEVYSQAESHMSSLCTGDGAPFAGVKHVFETMVARGVGYINHPVGLSVHDPAEKGWNHAPLREGFVCVMDPMTWCEDQHEYIRVEDTILVTSDGCERLTGDAPIEIDEIEQLMQKTSRFS